MDDKLKRLLNRDKIKKTKLYSIIPVLMIIILFGTAAICNQCGITPTAEIITIAEANVTSTGESTTTESVSETTQAQATTEQTTASEDETATKPTVNIDRIYGPVKEGDLCVQRFKANVTGLPKPAIKWNNDDSNSAFGKDVAQVNLKPGEEFELKVTISNSAGSASATVHVKYELPVQPTETTQTVSFTFYPKSGPAGTEVKLNLSTSIDSPVETYYDGQKLSWYIFTKTASADGKTLKEIIPAGASSGYFELKYEGKSVKATEPFTVTAPPQADLVITNVRSYSSTAGDTIIVDIKNAGTADLNNAKIHVLCAGHAIMRTNLNNIVPISSDEWIYITLNAGGVSWFFPYLILDFNLYTYPDVVCTAVLDGDPTPDNNVFGISIP